MSFTFDVSMGELQNDVIVTFYVKYISANEDSV